MSLGIRRGADGTFSYQAYLSARAAGLNPLHERGVESPVTESAGDAAYSERRSPQPAAGNGVGSQGALHSAHTAEKIWAAKERQLKVEEKLGALCDKRGAVEAGMKTGETLQELLRDRRRRLAEELAPVTDVGAIEAILIREDALFMANLQETMKRLLNVVEVNNVAAA